MKVKCINNANGCDSDLGVGKTYEVERERGQFYELRGHHSIRGFGYLKTRFEVVDEAPQTDQWDASRGPKMADPKGKAILKYQMPVLEQFEMKLPQGAEIIRMEDQGGMFWLWAVVDTRVPDETRKFRAFKTGASIPDNFDGKYVGFCKIHVQQELGLYIFEDVAR